MDKYYEKMKEYLSMDTEISYDEFAEFTKGVIEYLRQEYDQMDQEELKKYLFIVATLYSNCEDRAKRKGPLVKKYKKLMEKTDLWVSAINLKLQKMGMTQEEIDESYEQIFETV